LFPRDLDSSAPSASFSCFLLCLIQLVIAEDLPYPSCSLHLEQREMNKTGKFLFSETDSVLGLLPLQRCFRHLFVWPAFPEAPCLPGPSLDTVETRIGHAPCPRVRWKRSLVKPLPCPSVVWTHVSYSLTHHACPSRIIWRSFKSPSNSPHFHCCNSEPCALPTYVRFSHLSEEEAEVLGEERSSKDT